MTWNFGCPPQFLTSKAIVMKLIPMDRGESGLHAHIFKFSVRQIGAEIRAVENWLLQWLLAPKPLMRKERNLAWYQYWVWTTSTPNFSFLGQFLLWFSPPGYSFFGNSLFLKIHISEFLWDIKKSLLSDLEPYVGNPQKNWQVWKPCSFPETAHRNLNQLLGITQNILGIPVWNYQWRYRFWWHIWKYSHKYCMCHVIQEIWSWKFR